jgi:hypothetical protein
VNTVRGVLAMALLGVAVLYLVALAVAVATVLLVVVGPWALVAAALLAGLVLTA